MNNWSRKDLKARAKISFKSNYWKCVLAALIFSIVSGGAAIGAGSATGSLGAQYAYRSTPIVYDNDYNYDYDEYDDYGYDFGDDFDDDSFGEDFFEKFFDDMGSTVVSDDQIASPVYSEYSSPYYDSYFGWAAAGIIIVIVIILVVLGILGSLVTIFLFNPLAIGLQRFFYRNDKENASLDSIGFAFSKNYLNMVKIIFFRDIKLIGWTLLLIIPGIIKSYEYRMIPYILQDNPDINSKEAFSLSKIMMSGNKWRAFVLDFSFILWIILSAITLGIVGIFYVNPYIYQTNANLYAALKGDYEGMEVSPISVERPTEDADKYVEFNA